MGGSGYWGTDRLRTGVEGAQAVAQTFSGRARAALPALIDGQPGAVWMHEGAIRVAFRFTIANDRIAAIDLIADRSALERAIVER